MKDQITLIIPTHNRPSLIARALEYYGTWGCRLIVCDSSEGNPEPCNLSQVRYIHCPDLSFDRKIRLATEQVVTPYVCLSPDDDFLAPAGVAAGLEFLASHRDYVSVQGHYIQFGWTDGDLEINPVYADLTGFRIDDSEPGQRICHAMNPYMHHIYSLHRSEVLRNSLAISLDYNSPPLAEFSIALVGMIFGKHRMLPVFWMARDIGRYTNYNLDLNDLNTTTPLDMGEYLKTPDGIAYRDKFANAYAVHLDVQEEKGKAVFEQALEIYFRRSAERQAKIGTRLGDRVRNIVRKLAAPELLRWRRRLIQKGFLPRAHRKVSGYPWSDFVAKRQWDKMKEVIVRHGQFETVKVKWVS